MSDIYNANNKEGADKLNLPLISIITVVFNGVKTIEQTIQSVINQPYKNKEYIIIDGGSTDGTVEIIKKYESNLSFWISEHDKGIYDAMNKGIDKARGELIGIINADDWYEQNIFGVVADQYQKTGGKSVIHGLQRNFEDEEFYSITGNSIRRLRYDMIQHPTCFIPLKLYQTFGNYNSKYRYSADYDFILRLVEFSVNFNFIEELISNYRIGGRSSLRLTEIEMYKIRVKHHVISKIEGFLRITLVYLSDLLKTFLK